MSEEKEDFWLRYSSFCIRSKVCPLKSVLRHLKGTELCCPVESIRPEHWLFVLSALCNDNSLTKVHFASSVSPHEDFHGATKRNRRDKGFPTPYGRTEQNIRNLTMALGGMMRSSNCLSVLKLENLSLKILDAENLAAGFAACVGEESSLTQVSFSGCQFESGAVPIICKSLYSSKVSWLDLSACALNPSDIEAITLLIKAHCLKRSCEMHPKSLRYQLVDLAAMSGLKRISLNCNLLEHESVLLLVQSMADDLWMKAVDLQNCEIEDEGAEAFIKLASENCQLEIIDLRLNDIDKSFLHRLEEQLVLNRTGKTLNYSLMPLWKPSEMVRKYNTVGKVKVRKKPSVYKLNFFKVSPKSLDHSYAKPPSAVGNRTVFLDACVQTTSEIPEGIPKHLQDMYCELRNKYLSEDNIKHLQDMYFELRFKYQNEVKLKKYLMSKYSVLKTENDKLRERLQNQNDEIYVDQDTYTYIAHTLERLNAFLEVMKNYGIWEYIQMLGLDETTNVMMTESDSGKQMTITRKETCQDNKCRLESDEEPYCKCRKMDPKHKHSESCGLPEETQNCVSALPIKATLDQYKAALNAKATYDKYDVEGVKHHFLKDKGSYKLLQELTNDYTHAASHLHNQKSLSGRQTSAGNVPQDNTKAASSKQPGAHHMLIKQFSYSSMPKKLQELISPSDFYKLVKKELEARPLAHTINSSHRCSANASQIHSEKSVPVKLSEPNSASTSNKESTPVSSKESTPKHPAASYSHDEDYDNITISELIAREKALLASKQNKALRRFPIKQEPAKSSASSLSCSKTQNQSNHTRDKETFLKLDQRKPVVVARLPQSVLPKSNQKVSSSSTQTTSKKIPLRSNASSESLNSSNSIVTESDKLSASSAASSLSGSKSHTKSSSKHSESEPQKSYIESVSDASTFKDVKSISMSEIASDVPEEIVENVSSMNPAKEESQSSESSHKKDGSVSASHAAGAKDSESKNKTVTSVKAAKKESSQSSTIKNMAKIQNGKSDQSVTCKSPVQSKSKKTDRSTKANSPPQGKTKNGKNSKNRPKSNSKSSSVPSLSDITTVSSQSLNTDSVMKQISGSEDN